MKKEFITKITLMLTVFVFITGAFAFGESIKARMKARLPTINQLKAQGIVGENNKGFLEFRSSDRSKASIVNSENKDRATVYKAIAQKQGTTPDLVGKRRALQIRKIARPGTWLQDDSGKWYKK